MPGKTISYVLVFFSGFSGLVYEVLWRRALVVPMGATPAATATVLAAFMMGLALGAWFFGRWADRLENPAKLYAGLEWGLAFLALPILFLLLGVTPLMGFLWTNLNEVLPFYGIVRFLICFLLLLIPAALMGGTLPVMVRLVDGMGVQPSPSPPPASARSDERLSRGRANPSQIALLYALNTLGALAGCLATGFFFLERLGLVWTAVLAALINAGVGVAALSRWGGAGGKLDLRFVRISWTRTQWPVLNRPLILAFTAGFTSLALEVSFERVLVLLFGASPYAFTLMLASVLTALGGGAYIISKISVTEKAAEFWTPLFLGVGGLAALASLFPAANMATLHPGLVDLFGVRSWGGWAFLSLFESFLILGPSFLILGAVFPLAAAAQNRRESRGEDFGLITAANTSGAVLGGLAAAFLLLPALGSARTVALAALIAVSTSLLVLVERGVKVRGAGWAVFALSAGLLTLGPLMIPGDLLLGSLAGGKDGKRLLFAREGRAGTVTVESFPDRKTISVDGVNVAGSSRVLRTTQKVQAHLPSLIVKASPRVLQVGFGSGETARILGLYGASSIEVVEINPEVIVAAGRYFSEQGGNPRAQIILADAAQVMRARGPGYDLILNDSIHPSLNGNAALYSLNYFAACRKRLNPGGVLSSWLPLFGLGADDLRMIVRNFTISFPEALLFVPHNIEPRHALLVGWKGEGTPPLDIFAWRARLRSKEIGRDLASVGLDGAEALLDSFVMGGEKLRAFAVPSRPSTEIRPRLEFSAARNFGDDRLILGRNLEALMASREPVYPYLALPGDLEACRRVEEDLRFYYKSTSLIIRALQDRLLGRPQGVEELFSKALYLEPRNKAASYFLAEAGRERQVLKAKTAEDPSDAEGRFELGRSLWQGGDLARAETEFRAALLADKNFFEARLSLGHLHAIRNRWSEALADYREALKIEPESLVALRGLRHSQGQIGDLKGALESTRSILKRAGPSFEEYNQLGLLSSRLGDAAGAEKTFLAALELKPKNAETLNNLGILYHRQENYKKAFETFQRAAESDPSLKETYANLATAALRIQEFKEAERACRTALELDPSWAFAHALLGASLHAQGRKDEALASWGRALELDPNQPQAKEWLEKSQASLP